MLKPLRLIIFGGLCLAACSGSKSPRSNASSNQNDSLRAAANSVSLRVPPLIPEEEMLFSEVREFLELGKESIQDSLWFQAGEDFDSSLVRLSGLEATDSLSPNVYAMIKVYQDSVKKLLIHTVAMTSQMSQPAPLTQIFDEEMDQVSDSSVKAIDSITHHINTKAYDLPLPTPLEPRILQAMAVFMGPGRGYFTKWLTRKPRYEGIIRQKLDERDMPHDLMYLAMVESGFNPKAWSKASASGMWQFISSTGRRYGLVDDWWYDPRRDPLQATDAALDYLDDLNAEFNDWYLSMASYNCGEGKIRKFRERDPSMSYWKMPLPKETKFYVPKILAAMIIGHDPERYGFKIENPESPLAFDTASVGYCISIASLAKAAGVGEDTIISLNPSLRRWCTPPNKSVYRIYLPSGTRATFLKNYALIDKDQLVNWHRHVVLKGETIGSIAAKYHLSVAAIKATNRLKGAKLRRGQSLLIPLAPGDAGKYQETDYAEKPARGGKFKNGVYRVRAGDNLFDISRRFGTTVVKLLAFNHLPPGTKIHPGQRLRLGGKGAAPEVDYDEETHREPDSSPNAVSDNRIDDPTAKRAGAPGPGKHGVKESTQASAPKVEPANADVDAEAEDGEGDAGAASAVKYQIYTVGATETLFSISRKLGVEEAELRRWNGIHGHRILPGKRLKYLSGPAKTAAAPPVATAPGVKKPSPRADGPTAAHIVKPGENLYQIAKENGLDLDALRSLNGLDEEAEIHPGDSILLSGKAKGKSASSPKEDSQYYVVKAGDSLWDISQKFRTTVQKIKAINGRIAPVLKPGTRIRVK